MFWRAACMMVMFACVAIDARRVDCRHCGGSVGRSSRRLVLKTAGRDEGDVDVEQLAVISRDGSWNRAAGGLVWGRGQRSCSARPGTHHDGSAFMGLSLPCNFCSAPCDSSVPFHHALGTWRARQRRVLLVCVRQAA
ncbi:hypothetical protein FPV67DRAFT_1472427 [Lyophyllum atratum]|nr:hypothetical protein FPV67DRAFT_1472427 [Lyophyllum atratum]